MANKISKHDNTPNIEELEKEKKILLVQKALKGSNEGDEIKLKEITAKLEYFHFGIAG